MRDVRCRVCKQRLGHKPTCKHYVPPTSDCRCTTAAGLPKTPFIDQADAVASAVNMLHENPYVRIYRCPSSDRWHLTTKEPQHDRRPA